MSLPPSGSPEDRWRRTVELRGRPMKLKADRLFNEFGHPGARPGAAEDIESRLARVGLQVRPRLDDATADQVVTLEFVERMAEPAVGASAAAEEAPPAAEAGFEDIEQSTLVRAALEAERRVRNAYDRAAAAAAERVAALERELAAERAATTRARDERDELERRMHGERRAAAARQEALASAERTARGLLDAQRAQLSNLAQTLRVSTAAIAQTRETLDDVHGQVQQTAADVREALTESALDDGEIDLIAFEPPPPAAPEPAQQQRREIVLDEPAFDEPEASEAEPDAWAEPEVRAEGDADTADVPALDEPAAEAHPEAPDPPAKPEADVPPPARVQESDPPPKRGLGFARRRRRVSLACAVCGRSGKARDPQQLVDAGWHVEGDVALCLTCVADDWTFPEGETIPVRSHG